MRAVESFAVKVTLTSGITIIAGRHVIVNFSFEGRGNIILNNKRTT